MYLKKQYGCIEEEKLCESIKSEKAIAHLNIPLQKNVPPMFNKNEGYPICIATKEYQRRKHHKKRINKKWRNKYGTVELNSMPHGEIMLYNGTVWMTKKTFEELRLNAKTYKAESEE